MYKFATYFLLVLLCFIIPFTFMKHSNSETEGSHSRILVTAAHVGDVEGYDLIYVEKDADRAYHLKAHYNYETIEVGSVVVIESALGDIQGIVVNSKSGEFEVEVEDPTQIVHGMSGAPITLNAEPIGYVSALTEDMYILGYTLH